MSILDRDALEESPLADLHAIASELSIDGYRRLRRAELIDTILGRQEGRSGPSRSEPSAQEQPVESDELTPVVADELRAHDTQTRAPRRRGRGSTTRPARPARPARPTGTSARSRSADADASEATAAETTKEPEEAPADDIAEGVVELLPNGSGFLRVQPPDPSDDDVYISAAQIKRCELVSGDRVSGRRRAPRRSERFASLVRVDTVNDRPASELAEGARFEEMPAAFPDHRFRLGSDDPTVKAIEWLAPFGRGSRVTITGPRQGGKTEALRRLALALASQEDLELRLVLAGVRPEEIVEWDQGPVGATAAVGLGASAEAQDQTVEAVIDQARRLASRGAHVAVLIDTLEAMHPHAARKAMAAARNVIGGGSLTVIATAPAPIGGETTVIALDALLTATGRFPALDLAASWTMRAERLVGEAGAEAIARARGEALEG